MRQERVVAERPQMRIERLDPLLRRSLHDDAPAALERLFEQGREHPLDRLALQMIE
jgi:hypothetical protein